MGRRAARTIEGRENQITSLAMDLAEQQIREGTASSQVITHFLKAGSTKERLERERLERENEFLRQKAARLERESMSEERYQEAIDAFRTYSGHGEIYD